MSRRSSAAVLSVPRLRVLRAMWLAIGSVGLSLGSAFAQTPARPTTTIEQGAQNLRHRPAVPYPEAAVQKRVQGRVSLIAADEPGNIHDAEAIGRPIELRATALEFSCAGQTVTAQGTATPTRIRVGGAVQAGRLISSVPPVYPQAAKDKGIQGTVLLRAVVGKDGAVQELNVLEGPAELAPAALEAVKQWRYSVTKLNGEPVEVETEVSVRFSLSATGPEQ